MALTGQRFSRLLVVAGFVFAAFGCTATAPVAVECPNGLVACGDRCADLRLDDANCGGCGAACGTGTACANSTCLPTSCSTDPCVPGQVCVSDTCTDKACVGVICPAGATCQGGACQCLPGKERCGSACVNTKTDNLNCGGCDRACSAGTQCALGNCYAQDCAGETCGPGFVCAGGQCTEAACVGVACPAGMECTGGQCACTGPACECARDGECPEMKPHCDREAGRCAVCVTSTDCASGELCRGGLCTPGCSQARPACPAGKFCDFTAEACVDCNDNSQCGTGKICGPAKLCIDGCAADHPSCAAGTTCNVASQSCVACLADADCPAGRICTDSKTCVEGCSPTRPSCLGGKVCDLTAGACVDCLSDANCTQAGFGACNPATQTCVACTQKSHCTNPAAPACDPVTHQCVPCATSTDCPVGYLCQSNSCVQGCSATRPLCPFGQTCDAVAGRCVECNSNLDCPTSRPVCDSSNKRCVQCLPSSATSCPQGTFCDVNVCRSGCRGDPDCPSGKRCNTGSNFCQECLTNSDCTTDAGVARTCTAWGTCSNTCTSAANCASGELCCGSSCVRPLTDASNCGACGQACLSGQQCLAGVCQRYLAGLSMTVREGDSNGNVIYTQIDPAVDHCVDLAFPDCQWQPMDWRSAWIVWDGFINLPVDGVYGLATTSKNGSRVYVDGVLVVNNNYGASLVNPITVRDNRSYTAGLHRLQVQYLTSGAAGSGIAFQWAPPGGSLQVVPQSVLKYQGPCTYGETACGTTCTNLAYDDSNCGACGNACPAGNRCVAGGCQPTIPGLAAKYFDDWDYWNNSIFFQRTESNINTCDDWTLLACTWSPFDFRRYGVTWVGNLYAPEDGTYDLGLVGADGWRLYVDGYLIQQVNYGGGAVPSAMRRQNRVLLNRGMHRLEVHFFANGGGNPRGLTLFWRRPSSSFEPIPSTHLFSVGPCGPGETLCNSQCARLDRSNAHCGACNNLCANGTQCIAGSCAPVIPGIAAKYYDQTDYWNGNVLFDRIEPTVDHCSNWQGFDCSYTPLSFRSYGAVFDGYLIAPEDGIYQLGATGADGWRLYVDGYQVQNVNYIGSALASPIHRSNEMSLNKGMHRYTAHFWASGGGSPRGLSLLWGPPGTALTPIPSSNLVAAGPCGPGETSCNGTCSRLSSSAQNCGACGISCSMGTRCQAGQCVPVIPGVLGRYYTQSDYWNGALLYSTTENQLAFCNDPANLDCRSSAFTWLTWGAVWEGFIDAPASGTYALHMTGADGWRVNVDGYQVDAFNYIGGVQTQARTRSVSMALTSGLHPVRIEFWAAGGGAPRGFDLSWTPPGSTTKVSIPATNLVQRGPCRGGQVVCGSACTTLANDDANCGACGSTCGSGTRCIAGVCNPVRPGLSATYWDRADYWNGSVLWSRAEPDLHNCNNFVLLDCSWAPQTFTAYGTEWRGFLDVPTNGNYELGLTVKDSAILYLDGRELLRYNWNTGNALITPATRTTMTSLEPGLHALQVNYQSYAGAVPGNGIDLLWKPPGQASLSTVPASRLVYQGVCPSGLTYCGGACVYTQFDGANCGGCNIACGSTSGCVNNVCRPLSAGLLTRWWNSATGTGTPARTTTETQLNWCNEMSGTCSGGVPSPQTAPYRVISSGVLYAPTSGQYRFSLASRAGSRLTIDGRQIVNNSYVTSQDLFVRRSGSTFLQAGYHDLSVDHFGFQTTGTGVDLLWTPPGATSEVVVPAANLKQY